MTSLAGLESPGHSSGMDHQGDREVKTHRPQDLAPTLLAKLIEGEIIPRLLMAHRNSAGESVQPSPDHDQTIGQSEVAAFASLALLSEAHVLMRHVDAQLGFGFAVETILVELLAPTARALGVMWDNDEVDFIDVTMALWRLQEIVHELSARAPGAVSNRGGDRRALFCVMPGEQHSFGTVVVDECFRRQGWETRCITNLTEHELMTLVNERWFEIIGLTVSCYHHIDELSRFIGALRQSSRNPHAGVMVGGPLFVNNPGLAEIIGADGTASDARRAVECAEKIVSGVASSAAVAV
jgi:MerR family transcriptional regulator, light-induced transcriptional regulator